MNARLRTSRAFDTHVSNAPTSTCVRLVKLWVSMIRLTPGPKDLYQLVLKLTAHKPTLLVQLISSLRHSTSNTRLLHSKRCRRQKMDSHVQWGSHSVRIAAQKEEEEDRALQDSVEVALE